jgi:hypothetical protein
MSPCHLSRSVFSLWRQTPVRQSWLSGLPGTMIDAERSQAGRASAVAGISATAAMSMAMARPGIARL